MEEKVNTRHSGQGDQIIRTPTTTEGNNENERWLEFNDSSFVASSQVPEVDDDNDEQGSNSNKIINDGQVEEEEEEEDDASSQTFNFEARLGDLSCSLLDCIDGQHQQQDGALEESIVENLVTQLGKRDKTIAKLNHYLSAFLNQKGDGDFILNSVEKNLENLADGLKNSNFLTSSNKPVKKVADKNNVASTQTTEDLITELEELWRTPKSIRDFGTSISPPIQDLNLSYSLLEEVDSPLLHFNQRTHKEQRDQHLSSTPFINSTHQEESGSEEDDENNQEEPNNSGSPPKRRLSFAMNPDSLRLTFSPSICEYETESHCGPNDFSGPAIEDLRLQVIDIERKLEAEKKFLGEMTLEREQEREEFQRTINTLAEKYHEVKREKEKLENTVEHQQLEINELEEHYREKELVEDQLINKDCQLQQAVDKVVELREIIRGQEELIESMTKQSKVLLESKNETSEVLEADSDLSEACNNDTCHRDTSCISDLDHAEELQAQVDELAKKIEEKLVELENFSWQNRPNSSCSAAGDDVSVRGASTGVFNCDDSADARDFVARVFCGLRRLECSFDGLVRFEEVLLKKMKDAELKVGLDNKKIDELKAENAKLNADLSSCRQKIKDFEVFLKENRRRDHQVSFGNQSVERLRNAGSFIGKPYDGSSSPILRHNQKRGVDHSFPISTTEDMQQFEEVAYVPPSASPSEQPTVVPVKSETPAVVPVVKSDTPVVVKEESKLAVPEEPKPLEKTKSVPEQKPAEPELKKKEPSVQKLPSKEELPRAYSSHDVINVPEPEPEPKKPEPEPEPEKSEPKPEPEPQPEPEPVVQDEGTIPSDEKAEPEPPPETVEITTVSDFEVTDDGNITYLGTEIVPEDGVIPSSPPKEPEEPEEILTFENTVVTDVIIDEECPPEEGPPEEGSIIPPENLDAPVESNDTQTSRLEGLDVILELEKLKTQLSQTQRALDAEKEKSKLLENTLNEYPSGDVNRGRDPAVEEEVSQLLHQVKCRDQKYMKHMSCALARIKQLQEENEDLRAEIDRLQNGYDENLDQQMY